MVQEFLDVQFNDTLLQMFLVFSVFICPSLSFSPLSLLYLLIFISLTVNSTKQACARALFSPPARSPSHTSHQFISLSLSLSCSLSHCLLCLSLWGTSYSPYLTESGHPPEEASDFHNREMRGGWWGWGEALSCLLHWENQLKERGVDRKITAEMKKYNRQRQEAEN